MKNRITYSYFFKGALLLLVILISVFQIYILFGMTFVKSINLDVPKLTAWKPANTEKPAMLTIEGSVLRVVGDDSHFLYQIMTPSISVMPFMDYEFSIPVQVQQGNIAVGVLNGTLQKWLIPPVDLKNNYIVNTRFNTSVIIVISNANPENSQTEQSIFTIKEQ